MNGANGEMVAVSYTLDLEGDGWSLDSHLYDGVVVLDACGYWHDLWTCTKSANVSVGKCTAAAYASITSTNIPGIGSTSQDLHEFQVVRP